MPILLAINGHIYETSHFIDKHPGEGINNIYLNEYNRKEVTLLFNKFHQTEESEEHLIRARKGIHDKIKYIGPYYFQKRLPRYYHYIEDVTIINSTKIPAMSYFLFPSLDTETRDSVINIFVKDGMGMISVHHMNLETKEDDTKDKYQCRKQLVRCSVELCDSVDKEKNISTHTLEASSIEEFMEKYFTNQKYNPVYKIEM